VQPRLLHGDLLEVVDLRRVREAEDRADAGARVRVGDLPVREQLELLELLVDRHLPQKLVHAGLDARRPPSLSAAVRLPRRWHGW